MHHSNATLILPGAHIWGCAPEKVLGARHDWVSANPDTCNAMIRAVYKACMWLEQPGNTSLAVEILARSQHLDLPEEAIDPALTHHITAQAGTAPIFVEGFLGFHDRSATFPWRSQACWIADRLTEWHDLDVETTREVARARYRSDLYRAALAPTGVDMPGASEKLEGALAIPTAVASSKGEMILGPDRFFDDRVFDLSPSALRKK